MNTLVWVKKVACSDKSVSFGNDNVIDDRKDDIESLKKTTRGVK